MERDMKKLIKRANEIYIVYPRINAIFESIKYAYDNSPYLAEPECLLVISRPGVGKSTIIEVFAEDYRRKRTKKGIEVPVLFCKVPKPTTIKSFAITLLKALGDPFAERGNTTEITYRLAQLIIDCKVRMILLDEFQHLPESADPDIAADWLKGLIEATHVPVVLFGLPNSVEILNANEQLDSRFSNRIMLQPFQWEDDSSQKEFKRFLEEVDKELPLKRLSNLNNDDIAPRLFYASDGITRPLMRVILRAFYCALTRGADSISLKDLEISYDKVLGSRYAYKQNPFTQDFKPEVMEEKTYKDHLKKIHTPRPGVNSRIKKRKTREETFLDAIR